MFLNAITAAIVLGCVGCTLVICSSAAMLYRRFFQADRYKNKSYQAPDTSKYDRKNWTEVIYYGLTCVRGCLNMGDSMVWLLRRRHCELVAIHYWTLTAVWPLWPRIEQLFIRGALQTAFPSVRPYPSMLLIERQRNTDWVISITTTKVLWNMDAWYFYKQKLKDQNKPRA